MVTQIHRRTSEGTVGCAFCFVYDPLSTDFSPAQSQSLGLYQVAKTTLNVLILARKQYVSLQVTIVPRTNAALGFAQYSTRDRFLFTKEEVCGDFEFLNSNRFLFSFSVVGGHKMLSDLIENYSFSLIDKTVLYCSFLNGCACCWEAEQQKILFFPESAPALKMIWKRFTVRYFDEYFLNIFMFVAQTFFSAFL